MTTTPPSGTDFPAADDNQQGFADATGQPPVPAPAEPATVVRRPRRKPRLVPREKDDKDVVVDRRDLLRSTRAGNGKPQFSRERKIAGDLPDWEPLPPGEVLISRGSNK